MKKIILTFLVTYFFVSLQQTFSQVTLLSNNTNLTSGFTLNGKGFLLQPNNNAIDSIWVTDGTPAGTAKFISTVAYIDTAGAALYNNKVFFAGASAATGIELWGSDGTVAGTTLIKDINVGGNSVPTDFFVYNNTLFFTADNGTQGLELWKSDGTTAGTVLVKDIYAGAGNGFSYVDAPNYTISNGILYFLATTAAEGRELWRTDGSSAGTVLVKDITPGSASTTFNTIVQSFTTLGTNLIFGITVGASPFSSFQLWKTNGTSAGTTLLKDFGALSGLGFSTFYTFNSKIYFNAGDFTTGSEVWVTDGTVAGTVLVKDLEPGPVGSFPLLFLASTLNNKFYFQATTTNEGTELWVSDGTAAGTQLFKDINPGTSSSNPFPFKNFDLINGISNSLYNNKILFYADDGTHGNEVWVTDGTTAGTTLVKDINPGAASGLGSSLLGYFFTTSGLFFTADDGSGVEPWISDGTTAGTTRVFDVNPGSGSSNPSYLFILNNQLYFNANNGDNAATDLFKINATVFLLPVTLLNFSATAEPSNTVKLNWTTSTEINSSHFEVERSTDGSKFSKIGEVNAAGNSTINTSYTYLDQNVINTNSLTFYYRINMVDKDGKSTLSPILLVRLKEHSLQFTFSPNPAQKELNVVASPGDAKKAAIRIVDVNGRIVYIQTLPEGVNVLQQKINIAGLQRGAYFIQLISDNITTSKEFLKQ